MTTHPIKEAVARAICKSDCDDSAKSCKDNCSCWTYYEDKSAAAILALSAQEPTPGMVEAATEASDGWLYEHEVILVIKAALTQLAKEVEGVES